MVLDGPRRQEFESVHQSHSVGAPVRFDHADEHIHAVGLLLVGRLQHRIGLTDSGRGPEKDLQLSTHAPSLLGLHQLEQRIGIGSLHVHILLIRDRTEHATFYAGNSRSEGMGRQRMPSPHESIRPRRFATNSYGRPKMTRQNRQPSQRRSRSHFRILSNARFNKRTFALGSPSNPNWRLSICRATSRWTSAASSPRALATLLT